MYKDYDNKIYEGVYEANEKYGIASLTTKIISQVCGVSEGSFYRHFVSKEELLLKAYNNIDKEISQIFSEIDVPKVKTTFLIPKKAILRVVREKMWDPYFNYFINNPRKALFYIQYVELFGDNQDQFEESGKEDHKDYYAEFLKGVNKIDMASGLFKKIDPVIFWNSIIDSTLTYAKKIIQGKIKDTPENRDLIFNIIFNGVVSLV